MNGQVERFHSTLSEIMRCLKSDGPSRSFEELLERAVNDYNFTIHSTTNIKPIELFYGRIPRLNTDEFGKTRQINLDKLKTKQEENT